MGKPPEEIAGIDAGIVCSEAKLHQLGEKWPVLCWCGLRPKRPQNAEVVCAAENRQAEKKGQIEMPAP